MKFKENDSLKALLEDFNSLFSTKEKFIMAGFPRFLGLFGRDSLIASWQLLDYDPKISKSTLETLAKFQGKKKDFKTGEEPGKILHEYYPKSTPDSWWQKYKANIKWLKRGEPTYMSLDSTPLFLIVLAKYYKKTKDIRFLQKIWRNAERAANWMIDYGDMDGDGFLEYQRKNPIGLFHQGWKDGHKDHLKIKPPVAIVEIQGYQYLALKEITKIAGFLGKNDLAKNLELRAEKLKKDFNKKFWISDKKYFALALDDKKHQRKVITSNPGHLLFTGILEKDKEEFVVKRLFQKDMWTLFGIRSHSSKEPDFNPRSYHLGSVWPHDNWIIGQGLKKLGYKKEYLKIKNALLRAYKEIGFIPEFYGVIDNKITLKMKKTVCHPQAWASGALFNFINQRFKIL